MAAMATEAAIIQGVFACQFWLPSAGDVVGCVVTVGFADCVVAGVVGCDVDGDGLRVSVGEGLGLMVGLGVGVAVGVCVGWGVGVGVCDSAMVKVAVWAVPPFPCLSVA
jgi:hypothetical protein